MANAKCVPQKANFNNSRLNYGNSALVSILAYLQRLQLVLNAAARLIYRLGFRDHVTDALISLYWLRVPERVKYKVAMLTYKALHNTAPRYLGPLVRVTDIPGRRALRSAVTDRLHDSALCNSVFPVAAPKIWNSLPDDIVYSASLSTFCHLGPTANFFVYCFVF